MIDENEKVCPICAEDTGFGEEPKEPQEEHVAEEPEIVEEPLYRRRPTMQRRMRILFQN